MSRLAEPGFAARHRRRFSLRHTSRHVNPLMLAVADAESNYVREWRAHARGCRSCAELFRYFGLDDGQPKEMAPPPRQISSS